MAQKPNSTYSYALAGGVLSTLLLSLYPCCSLAQLSRAGDDAGPSSSPVSSNSNLPHAPDASPRIGQESYSMPSPGIRATRPFRSLAVGLTLGTGGIGVELATPVTSKINLRGTASFFSYGTSFVVDTIPIDGKLHLASVAGSIDWFPTAGNFHISPGITFYENTNFNATIFIPGNQVVKLDDQPYTSDPDDPIHGTAFVGFGHQVAPRLTVGWGNVIRHHTSGFTFPVELGVEYIKPPTATFVLTGSSCDSVGNCGPIQSDPTTQQNIDEQQTEIVNDLHPLRFFPILSVGISYKFGH